MKYSTGTLLLLLTLASGVEAQDGGKLPWKGKGSDDARAALTEAQRQGKAAMLFFTSEG